MADAKKDSKKAEEGAYWTMIPGKPAFIVGMLAAIIGFFQIYPEYFPDFGKMFNSGGAVASPTPAEAAPVVKEEKVFKRLEFDPEQWSEWVQLPDGINLRFVHPNRKFELLFPDGTIRQYKDDGLPKSRDPLPGSRFRVRGELGTMEIVLESK